VTTWSLKQLLAGLHEDIHRRLETSRRSFGHPGTKGDASESVWLSMLSTYLPKRYQAAKAHVVDSRGTFSDQIDVVIFDRQYSPFIFTFESQTIVPAESVYAVFEAKQSINASEIAYAQAKVASVRKLFRTSLPIPHAGGTFPAKALIPIKGGILTFDSDWSPPLGSALMKSLQAESAGGDLDLGCVAAHGYFVRDNANADYQVLDGSKPATAFLFRLISDLQFSGTVPMIDIQAYAQWLAK
jgi:hypothetical protein